MSTGHAWLRFVSTGRPLDSGLQDETGPWQQLILADHRRWYGPHAPVQVSGAFVLQYLLQVPAHTAATAAAVGMRVSALQDLTFERGPGGVPALVEVGDLERLDGDLDDRLALAKESYREVAAPLAEAY